MNLWPHLPIELVQCAEAVIFNITLNKNSIQKSVGQTFIVTNIQIPLFIH